MIHTAKNMSERETRYVVHFGRPACDPPFLVKGPLILLAVGPSSTSRFDIMLIFSWIWFLVIRGIYPTRSGFLLNPSETIKIPNPPLNGLLVGL